jgi:hypothetical protein
MCSITKRDARVPVRRRFADFVCFVFSKKIKEFIYMKKLSLFGSLFLLLFIAGCSGNVSVNGKVVFDDDTPLTKGTVFFDNQKEGYQGKIKDDGTFQLGIQKDNQRIPKGKYQVYLTSAYEIIKHEDGSVTQPIPLVDEKFFNSSTSGIEIEVVKGMDEIVIRVQKPDPKLVESLRKTKITPRPKPERPQKTPNR